MNIALRRHPRAASLCITVGATTALLGSFLPWLRTGSRTRTSYALFQLVDRLGFSEGGVAAWLFRLWPLVPFLTALIITLQWWHPTKLLRRLGAVLLPIFTALTIGGVSTALLVAPDIAALNVGIGPFVTALGGGLMLLGAFGAIVAGRR